MTWNYSKKTTELFMRAVEGRPGSHMGEIENPDGFGEHGSIACGDALRFTFRVARHATDPLQDRITEARYLTFGCTSAIASSEALCAIIEDGDYTPLEALKIGNADIVDYLGGLPQQKVHCSVMGAEALEAAVFNWAQRRGVNLAEHGVDLHPDEREEGRIVCTCYGLSEPYLLRKISELGLRTIDAVTGAVKAGGACMSCHHTPGGLQDLLDRTWGRQATAFKSLPVLPSSPAVPALPQELSPFKFAKLVEQVIADVAPLPDTVEIIDIKGVLVFCRFPDAAGELKILIENALKERVDQSVRVVVV